MSSIRVPAKAPPKLSTLPDLCLLSIFGHLPMLDLYCRVPLVCTRFAALKPSALAQRTHLVLMSSREKRSKVVDLLYSQQYRQLRPFCHLIEQLPANQQVSYRPNGGARLRYSREAIEKSIIRIRDRFHIVHSELDYLRQLPKQFPNLTRLDIMFGFIPYTDDVKWELHEDWFDRYERSERGYISGDDDDYETDEDDEEEESSDEDDEDYDPYDDYHFQRQNKPDAITVLRKEGQCVGCSVPEQIAFIIQLFADNDKDNKLTSLTVGVDLFRFFCSDTGNDGDRAIQLVMNKVVRQVNRLVALRELNFHYSGQEPTESLTIAPHLAVLTEDPDILLMQEGVERYPSNWLWDSMLQSLPQERDTELHLISGRKFYVNGDRETLPSVRMRAMLRNASFRICYTQPEEPWFDILNNLGPWLPSLTALTICELYKFSAVEVLQLLSNGDGLPNLTSLIIDFNYRIPKPAVPPVPSSDMVLPSVRLLGITNLWKDFKLADLQEFFYLGQCFPAIVALKLNYWLGYKDDFEKNMGKKQQADEVINLKPGQLRQHCWSQCPQLTLVSAEYLSNTRVFRRSVA